MYLYGDYSATGLYHSAYRDILVSLEDITATVGSFYRRMAENGFAPP